MIRRVARLRHGFRSSKTSFPSQLGHKSSPVASQPPATTTPPSHPHSLKPPTSKFSSFDLDLRLTSSDLVVCPLKRGILPRGVRGRAEHALPTSSSSVRFLHSTSAGGGGGRGDARAGSSRVGGDVGGIDSMIQAHGSPYDLYFVAMVTAGVLIGGFSLFVAKNYADKYEQLEAAEKAAEEEKHKMEMKLLFAKLDKANESLEKLISKMP